MSANDDTSPTGPFPCDRQGAAGLTAVLLLAACLRFWNLHSLPLDYDEVWEVTHATSSLSEQIHRVEGFPPLFGWLLGGVMEIVPGDETARGLSAVLGVVAVGVAAWIGRQAGGVQTGFWSALFLAISPYHVMISRSSRPYSMYVLVCALAIACSWRLREHRSPRDWLLFGLAAWVALATGYLSGILIGLLILMVFFQQERSGRRQAALMTAGLAIACLPLLYCLRIDLMRDGTFFLRVVFDKETYFYTYQQLVTGGALGPAMDELREMTSGAGLAAMAPWAAGAAAPVIVLLVMSLRKLPRWMSKRLMLLIVLGPPLLALLSLLIASGYKPRYVSWLVVPLTVALAGGAGFSRIRPIATLATVGMLMVFGMSLFNYFQFDRYTTQNFAALRTAIDHESPSRGIITAPAYFGRAVEYHFGSERIPAVVTSADPNMDDITQRAEWAASLEQLERELGDEESIALVLQWTPADDPRRSVLDRLAELLNAEFIARPSSGVLLYQTDGDSVRSAITELNSPVN